MLSTLVALTAMLPQSPGTSSALVVINEFNYDDTGTDNREFVELYNRTDNPVPIGSWVLGSDDGTNGVPNTAFTIPAGTVLAARSYYVIGTGNGLVPNVTQTTTAATNVWENGPDTLVLRDNLGNVIDSVCFEMATWATTVPIPAYIEGTGLWGDIAMADGETTVPTPFPAKAASMQRKIDGWDTNDNGADFVYMPWTPGTANGTGNTLPLGYEQNFDGAAGTNLDSDASWSFVPGTIYAPGAVTNATGNVIVIPPSPQGGNIGCFNDPTGGGNLNQFAVQVSDDYLVECYMYIAGGNANFVAADGEAWALGVRGTSDGFGHPVDVPGTYYAAITCTQRSYGATGLCWMGYVRQAQTEIYLVDMNNGSTGFSILGGPIVATPGVNDGWQRLRIRVQGTSVIGNFGGTLGCDDGQRFTGTAAQVAGTVFVQYRECIAANAQMTPPLLDALQIYGAVNQGATFAGTGSPTTLGVPLIGTSGPATLGNTSFALTGSNLVQLSLCALELGVGSLGPGIQIPGAQLGALLFVNPLLSTNILISDSNGDAALAIPLPCINRFAGLPITAQILALDLALTDPLPIGTSTGMQVVIGN